MNKLWKSLLALSISTSLVLSSLPMGNTQKDSSMPALQAPLASAAVQSGITDLRKNNSVSSYKKGEAIVFMRTSKNLTAKSDTFFGNNIMIKNVWNFGTSKDNSSSKNLYQKVAVVSSDTYSTKQLIKKLRKHTGVVYAEPNYRFHATGITADSYSDYQWALSNTGQNGGSAGNDISIEAGWQAADSKAANSAPVVAVLDSGVNLNHEELKGHLWTNTNTRDLKGLHGYDFANADTDPSDDNGHGTHVAGIISASANNNAGIAGVSPDVQIMALKFLDEDGSGYLEDALAAYNYIYCAQQLGVNVVAINNSWGGEDDSNYVSDIFTAIVDLVGEQGAISVWAAGNEAANNDGLYGLPASMSSPYLITVAASDENGELASYSNYGKASVDIAAPGNNILSLAADAVYNPTLYDSQTQEAVSYFYENFNSASPAKEQYQVTTGSVIDLSSYVDVPDYEKNYTSSSSVITTTAAGFGLASTDETKQNALSLNLQDTVYGEIYNLAIPYEAPADTTDGASYSLSMMLKSTNIPKNGDLLLFVLDVSQKPNGNYNLDATTSGYILEQTQSDSHWSHLQFEAPDGIKAGDKRALLFVAIPLHDGTYELQLDDIGISHVVEEGKKAELFGTYEFESGTSMATPVVTGAVALMHRIHPEYNTEKLRAAVCGMVKPDNKLQDKLRYGGILDFDYQNKLQPSLTDAYASGGVLTLKGYFFGNTPGNLYINGELADNSKITWTDEIIQIADASYTNHNVNFCVENEHGSSAASLFVYNIDKSFTKVHSSQELFEDGQIFSDGTTLYCMTESGFLYEYGAIEDYDEYEEYETVSSGRKTYEWNLISYLAPEDLFASISDSLAITVESEFLFLNGSIYGIISYGTDYLKNYYIVRFGTEDYIWTVETELPDDDAARQYEYSTFAAYNSSLYLIGGYNTSNHTCATMVKKYDIYMKKWSDAPSLPTGRYLSYGRQIGNKLYITLGGNATGAVPATAVFDGKEWKESPAQLSSNQASYLMYPATGQTDYYEIDEYSGKKIYYHRLPYYKASVGISAQGLVYAGLTCESLGDVFTYDIASDNYVTSIYSLHNIKNVISGTSAGDAYYLLSWDDMLFSSASLYSMPITTANVTIYDKSDNGGFVVGTGTFLPGTTTVLSAQVKNNYRLKSYTLDGEKLSGYMSLIVTEDHIAKVTTTRRISTLRFSSKSIAVAAGHKITLSPVIKPKSLSGQLRYSSSNKKVVTVSKKKGVVKAKKSAVGKKATITVKANDGSKKKATCRIRVTTPAKSLSIRAASSTVKAGKSIKLTASTMPQSAANAVVWKTSNKRYATVSAKGVVKAKKAGKGKNVKITATTTDGTKIRRSIRIRIQ